MRLVVKTGFECALRQWKFSGLHRADGVVNALPQDKLMRRQTDRCAELTGEMKRADVRWFGQRPFAGADGESMSYDIVLRQFLRLEPMPLDDDAVPTQRHATQQDRSRRCGRKRFAVRDVNQCDFTGMGNVSMHGSHSTSE